MARLQGAGKSKHQRDVLLLNGLLADVFHGWRWASGQTAGKGRVGVDVELEQVEEGVGHHGHSTVDLGFDAVVELQGFVGLLADGKGDVFELVILGILNVLAGFPGWARKTSVRCGVATREARVRVASTGRRRHSRAPVHTLDADGGAIVVAGQRDLSGRARRRDSTDKAGQEQAQQMLHGRSRYCSRAQLD